MICLTFPPQGSRSGHQSNTPPHSAAGSVARSVGGLDITALAPAVQEGLAPSTRWTYSSAMKKFATFCAQYDVPNPFPVTEYRLRCFTSYMADQGLAPQSIKSYLAAACNMQVSHWSSKSSSVSLEDPSSGGSPCRGLWATASALGHPRQRSWQGWRIPPFSSWVGGGVLPSSGILGPPTNSWRQCP